MSIVPEETQEGTNESRKDHGYLPHGGKVEDIEIIGQYSVTRYVGHDGEGHQRRYGGTGSQPIQTISQVHRIGGSKEDQKNEWNIDYAQWYPEVLEE